MSFDLPPDSNDEGNLPDWLKDLQSEDSYSESADDDLFGNQSDQDNPEWLGEADDTGVYKNPPQQEEKDVPSWLASIREAEGIQEQPGGETPPDSTGTKGGESDWMENIRQKEGSSPEPDSVEENGGDLLSRLQSLQAAEQTQSGAQDDWLGGLTQDKSSEDDAPFSLESDAGELESPDWVSGLDAVGDQPGEVDGTPDGLGGDATLLDSDIPDFYKQDLDLGQEAADGLKGSLPEIPSDQPEAAPEKAAGEDSAGWLASLAGGESSRAAVDPPVQPIVESPADPPPSAVVNDTPSADTTNQDDWFAATDEPEEDPMEWFTGEESGDEEDVPEWVLKLEAKSPFKEVVLQEAGDNDQPVSQAPAEEKSSDWVADQAAAAGDFLSGSPDPAEELESAGSISWLDNLQGETSEDEGQTTPAAEDSPVIEISDYSFDAESASLLEPTDLPDWLNNSAPEQQLEEISLAPEQPLVPAAPPADTGAEIDQVELPSIQSTSEDSEISRGDLPSWLQALRPIESITPSEEPGGSPAGFTEAVGPLAGLSDVLPAQPGAIAVGKPAGLPAENGMDETIQQFAHMLQKMVAGEEQTPPLKRKPLALPPKIIQLSIAVILYAIVFLPVFFGTNIIAMPDAAAMPPHTQSLFSVIESIPPGAPVLVAFEYQPGYSGEISAAAAPVVNHILDKGGFLALVSSQPLGPALGENFLRSTQSHQPAVFNHNFVNLGYVSGGGGAILNLAEDPRRAAPLSTQGGVNRWDQAPLNTIRSIRDFALVLVLTEDPDRARSWVEQTYPALANPDNPAAATPLLMVVSAQAEPMVMPYYLSSPPQVTGLLSGANGGAYYQVQTNSQGPVAAYWSSYNIGLLTTIVILLFGSALNLARTLFIGRRSKGTRP